MHQRRHCLGSAVVKKLRIRCFNIPIKIIIIIIIIINFYSPVSNTRCHSIGHKMRIARIKIRVDSPGEMGKSPREGKQF